MPRHSKCCPEPKPSKKCNVPSDTEVIAAVQQRFYAFQNATSELKRQGHNPDQSVFNAALANFLSFIDPDFILYEFNTVDVIIPFATLADISAGYTFYGQVLYNGYSQHYAEDTIVNVVQGTNKTQAHMISGGGEYGSTWTNLATSPPTDLSEQHTVSQWDITWIFKNGNWYIYSYIEYGNRIYRFTPPSGPEVLYWGRTYPGAVTPPSVVDPGVLANFRANLQGKLKA